MYSKLAMSRSAKVEHHPPLVLGTLTIVFINFTGDRRICQRCKPERVAPRTSGIIQGLGMLSDTLVPHDNRAWLVPHATREVVAAVNVAVQELKHTVRLLVVPTHDPLRIRRVDEESLLLRHRVDRNDRVD